MESSIDEVTGRLDGRTVVVTGASRGFGRASACALVSAGATVIGIARSGDLLHALADELGERFIAYVGDATHSGLPTQVLEGFLPTDLVLSAGARPRTGPLTQQSWETFSENWMTDTQHVFHWTVAALQRPLAPGSVVVSVSSGAARRGSPLSGGYAPAKAAIRFINSYAATESNARNLGLRFVTLLPQLTPATGLGQAGVSTYAAAAGLSEQEFLRSFEPLLTAEQVGAAVVETVAGHVDSAELLVSGSGLQPLEQA